MGDSVGRRDSDGDRRGPAVTVEGRSDGVMDAYTKLIARRIPRGRSRPPALLLRFEGLERDDTPPWQTAVAVTPMPGIRAVSDGARESHRPVKNLQESMVGGPSMSHLAAMRLSKFLVRRALTLLRPR